MTTLRHATALALLAACIGLIASLLMPNPGTAAHHRPTATVTHAARHSGGTAVSSTLDGLDAADAAFLADLFDGATDYTPAQATDLIGLAHRICDLAQPRTDWLAALTAPGPGQLTTDEAGKLLDTAEAAYCPALVGAGAA